MINNLKKSVISYLSIQEYTDMFTNEGLACQTGTGTHKYLPINPAYDEDACFCHDLFRWEQFMLNTTLNIYPDNFDSDKEIMHKNYTLNGDVCNLLYHGQSLNPISGKNKTF